MMCKNFELLKLMPEIPNMEDALEALLRQVPSGKVTTYGDLAEALGNRIAAPWVGHYMMHHNHDPGCGCHRVVRASGELGRYIDGPAAAKIRRLRAEGVGVKRESVDLDVWRLPAEQFVCDRPLETLQRTQETQTAMVSLRARKRIPKLVGGVDVSYPTPTRGVAGYALVELQTGRLAWSTMVHQPVTFPYITSYLAYSECVVRRLMLGRRLPEPLYWADRQSRRAGRDIGPTEG